MQNLKNYFNEIEHLPYSQRQPYHATLFENKAALSKLIWDIHSHNACVFYRQKEQNLNKSTLSEKGLLVGQLSAADTELLQKIFSSCEKKDLDPFHFDSDYFYEPRVNVHEHMSRINDYYEPSEFLFDNLPKLIEPLIKTIEQECGFYWKVASLRIFQVKPVASTQGLHKDDQPYAIKKLFFYPNGVSKKLGSTHIETKDGKTVIVDGGPGTWALFENSLVDHQAFSSIDAAHRPTIEIDIMPDFKTDPTLLFVGVNSWHPWFPLEPKNKAISLNTKELNFDEVYERTLRRIAGLCTMNKIDRYRFPVDFKDIEINDDILQPHISQPVPQSAPVNPEPQLSSDFKVVFNQLLKTHGYKKILFRLISIAPKKLLRKLKPKKNKVVRDSIY